MVILWSDIRHALRTLLKSPGFSLVAVVSLALAIGANTTVFSLLNTILLRKLPVPHPDQLIQIFTIASDGETGHVTIPAFREIESSQQVFSSMFCWWDDVVLSVDGGYGVTKSVVWGVSGNFYSELGASPYAGRLLASDDVHLHSFAHSPVAVIGYRFWQRYFAGDHAVVGKTVRVESVTFTIVGVMNRGFTGTGIAIEPDIVLPLTAAPLLFGEDLQRIGVEAAGRLKNGVTLAQAHANLESLWPGVQAATLSPDYSLKERDSFLGARIAIESLARGWDQYIRGRYTTSLNVLLAIAAVILLIACVNLAGLMMARASGSSRALGIRVALGARGWFIAKQLLVESMLLSLMGGAVGFLLALWAARALASFMLQIFVVPETLDLNPDIRVVGFAAVLLMGAGILSCLPAVWKATRQAPLELLQKHLSVMGMAGPRLGQTLVSAQAALSLLLLIGAGLFVRNLRELRTIDVGFRSDGVLLMTLDRIPGSNNNMGSETYYQELVQRISRLPGVQAVSLSNLRAGNTTPLKRVVTAFPSRSASEQGLQAGLAIVTPGFFEALKMRMLQGRDFEWSDDGPAPRVAVVSQHLAKELFPSGHYLGRHLQISSARESHQVEIVGVVSDARLYNLHEPAALAVYVPFLQEQEFFRSTSPRLQIRVSVSPLAITQAIHREIESLGYQYPSLTTSLAEIRDRALLTERITAALASFLGLLALLLSSIGLYGLVAYNVSRRTRDIGVRFALGAERASIFRMILQEAMLLVLAGVAVGIPVALVTTKLVRSLLFAVSPTDPVVFIMASLALLFTAALAGYVPARRAMRIDPAVLLRLE